jgi:Fe2+ or Zn2+ uptake regulation protein
LEQSTDKSIDISTIYRNLELFDWLGIVHKIYSIWWYMPCSHHHDHCHKVHDLIICNTCNTISETHIDPNTKQLLWLSGWPVELSGHCTSCEQKK